MALKEEGGISQNNDNDFEVNEYQELKGESIFGTLFVEEESEDLIETSPLNSEESTEEKILEAATIVTFNDKERIIMCSELKEMDISESVRLVFMGIQTGWKTEEIVALTDEEFLKKNTPLFKALTLYFKDKFK